VSSTVVQEYHRTYPLDRSQGSPQLKFRTASLRNKAMANRPIFILKRYWRVYDIQKGVNLSLSGLSTQLRSCRFEPRAWAEGAIERLRSLRAGFLKLNLPNKLTVLRVLLVPVFIAVRFLPTWWSNAASAVVFAVWMDTSLAPTTSILNLAPFLILLQTN